jgi:hypothetical protein
MDENDVGVAAPRDVQRLSGAESDDVNLDAGLVLEDGQQMTEQARLLGRRGGSDRNEPLLRTRRPRGERQQNDQSDATGH